jgi:SAM-dependent methyltransferase
MLGAIRDGNFIGSDNDLDIHYISHHVEPSAVAEEFEALCYDFIDRGYRVKGGRSHAVIRAREDHRRRVDISPNFFDADGILQFPFGILGDHLVDRENWTGTREVPLGSGTVVVPDNAETMAECIYGPNWRTPDPGFSWTDKRRGRVWAAMIDSDRCERIYWASAHANDPDAEPSAFCLDLLGRDDLPATVVDLGCGAGRDTLAFARDGRRVVAVDRCPRGLERTGRAAADAELSERVRIESCDFVETAQVARLLSTVAGEQSGPVLYYARFLLHALTEQTQEVLLSALGAYSRPGDLIALEFRTLADRSLPKANSAFLRRFQDGARVRDDLHRRFGFEPLVAEEGSGLAAYTAALPPCATEDPVVYRLLARREEPSPQPA